MNGRVSMVRRLSQVIFCMAILLMLSGHVVAAEPATSATGDTLIYVIMVSDQDRAFTSDMKNAVASKMSTVAAYYHSEAPDDANLDITVEYAEATIAYDGNYGDFNSGDRDIGHVEKALDRLGYAGDTWREKILDLAEQKKAEGYDNVVPIFVAPDMGRSYAAYHGDAEFTTVFYLKYDGFLEKLFSLDDTPAVVYAHEIGHIFGAADEYSEEETGGSYGERGPGSEPMQRLYPSFNYEKGPVEPEESIMVDYNNWEKLGWFDLSTPFSIWAEGMIGWRDFDMDGTLDPFDDEVRVEFPGDRKPILNAAVNTDRQIRYDRFDEVTATAKYDHTELLNSLGFSLKSPTNRRVDTATHDPVDRQLIGALLDADVPDADKPGNWTVEYLYGADPAAWYTIEVIAPLLELPTDTIDFGRVRVGEEATVHIDILNKGKMRLVMGPDKDASTGELVRYPLISVSERSNETIRFSTRPDERGDITGSVVYETNDPRTPETTFNLAGVAYIIRQLAVTGPDTTTVDDDVSFNVAFEDATDVPASYDVSVKRNGEDARQDVDIIERTGEIAAAFSRYGDYTVTVNKENTTEIEYIKDTASIVVERIQRSVPLELDTDRATVKTHEPIHVTATAEGAPVEAELRVNGEHHDTGTTFTVTFAEPDTHELELVKPTVTTDRERITYEPDSTTITVEERTLVERIQYWLTAFIPW